MISKQATYQSLPNYPDVKDDYVRRIANHTGVPIRITDSSGRITIHESLPRPEYSGAPKTLIIDEWFGGTNSEGMVDVTDPYEGIYMAHVGVKLKLTMTLEDLSELSDGVYLEECSLHVCLAEYQTNSTHPRFCSNIKGKLRNSTGVYIGVELLDPRKCHSTLYANIGGRVYVITPKRFPTPDTEGIILHHRDSSKGLYSNTRYAIEDFLEGEGIDGIRLYRTEIEAKEDDRHPDKADIIKMKKRLRDNERGIYEEGRASYKKEADIEAEKVRAAHAEKLKKIQAEADEKLRRAEDRLRRAEDLADKTRNDKRNDKTGIWANVVKMAATIVGFCKSIFT